MISNNDYNFDYCENITNIVISLGRECNNIICMLNNDTENIYGHYNNHNNTLIENIRKIKFQLLISILTFFKEFDCKNESVFSSMHVLNKFTRYFTNDDYAHLTLRNILCDIKMLVDNKIKMFNMMPKVPSVIVSKYEYE